MKICGFGGESGSGKTTLIAAVLAGLKAQGQRVSFIKHAHAGFDIDKPGKDSHRQREAGAFEVLLASDTRLALLREFDAPLRPSVHQLVNELAPCDWVLVEGYSHADIPRVEVLKADSGRLPHYPEDPYVVAVVSDDPARLPQPTLRPVWARGEEAVAGLLALLQANANGRFDYDPERYV